MPLWAVILLIVDTVVIGLLLLGLVPGRRV